jgi:hypothetical protein
MRMAILTASSAHASRCSVLAGMGLFSRVARVCRNEAAASFLPASGFRGDVTVFRLNAAVVGKSCSRPAFRRNTAEHVYTIEAAHNPEVAGSNPAPATGKARSRGSFTFSRHKIWSSLS